MKDSVLIIRQIIKKNYDLDKRYCNLLYPIIFALLKNTVCLPNGNDVIIEA